MTVIISGAVTAIGSLGVGGALLGGAALGAGATIYASSQQQKTQQQAIQQQAQTQQQATTQLTDAQAKAIAALQQGQQQGLSAVQQYQQPFINYGLGQGGQLDNINQLLTKLATPGPDQISTLSQLPAFQFNEDLAKWGIQAGAGRSGFSGTTAYQGGSLASQIAQQAFNQELSPIEQLYQQYATLYGAGANAASNAAGSAANIISGTAGNIGNAFTGTGQNIANVTTGTGGNIAQLLTAQGQTQAGGITGAAGGIGNALTLNALISGLKNQNAGAVPNAMPINQNTGVPLAAPPIQYGGPFQAGFDPANA